MNKNELEARKVGVSAQKFGSVVDLVATVVKWGALVWLGQMFFDAVVAIGSNNPESIRALATVIEKFEVSKVVHGFVTLGIGVAWYTERKGKKRAIRKLADQRHQTESKDAYHASSHLDEDGDTPT